MSARFEAAARRLPDTTFTNSVMQINLPKDGIYRALNLEFHGSIVTTFASGSPAAPAESTIDSLIQIISVTVNGRALKVVRPHMLHAMEILAFGQEGRRSASAGASAVTGDLPTTDGGFVYGTTTQVSTVREQIQVPFEMILANNGREKTWLDCNGISSGDVKLFGVAYSNLDTTSDSALSFSASTFVIEAYLEEVIGVMRGPGHQFSDFQQIMSPDTITAAANGRQYQLNPGSYLAGVLLYVKSGSTTLTATAADLGLTDIKFMTGNKILKQVDFNAEQAKMRQNFKVNSARTSGKSRMDGICYISFLTNNRDLNTAFDARNLQSLIMAYSSSSSATYNLTTFIEQHLIITPQ